MKTSYLPWGRGYARSRGNNGDDTSIVSIRYVAVRSLTSGGSTGSGGAMGRVTARKGRSTDVEDYSSDVEEGV